MVVSKHIVVSGKTVEQGIGLILVSPDSIIKCLRLSQVLEMEDSTVSIFSIHLFFKHFQSKVGGQIQ